MNAGRKEAKVTGSKPDWGYLRSAISFAVSRHKDHYRSDGEPYITHLARVATLVGTFKDVPAHVVAAAWLHDCVEDVGVSYTELWDVGFTPSIVTLVHCLTNTDTERSPEETVDYIARGGYWALALKMADRLDNLRDGERVHGISYVVNPKRLATTRLLLEKALEHGLGTTSVFRELAAIVRRVDG